MSQKEILKLLEKHYPSIEDEDERQALEESGFDYLPPYYATCGCGVRVDGYYAYVDHLKNIISTEVQ